ncbi:MAG: ABC transporter ATP-binding protein [Clostridiales bacterium]|jgi:ABC-2 type transport system ATP-binding protein|nr:ABC transporter ATP-binding protein [Clostridiales bacterium]
MVIRVNDVRKKFKIYHDKGSSLKERLLFTKRYNFGEHHVLNGISFQAERGESIGLIGENGCGKSTLLKLMTRIMYPDSGSIEIDGRVSSLIELGAGFHPHMSGRENIYTNAAIFGLNRAEINMRVKDIIDFSELGEYIDSPVRTYSSGMYMRLAFSVAINVDADVLLIDEILAVGDANFQAKCFEKLRELKAAGVTSVIVTHDMGTIEKFCTQALWINDGVVEASGNPSDVVRRYLAFMSDKHFAQAAAREQAPEEAKSQPENTEQDPDEPMDTSSKAVKRFGPRHVEITGVDMKNGDGVSRTVFLPDESVALDIHYKVNKPVEGYVFGYAIHTMEGVNVSGSNTQLDNLNFTDVGESGYIEVEFEKLPLVSGRYVLQVAVSDNNGRVMDYHTNYTRFEIISEDRGVGIARLSRKWSVVSDDA